jgi:hypothetical protein
MSDWNPKAELDGHMLIRYGVSYGAAESLGVTDKSS